MELDFIHQDIKEYIKSLDPETQSKVLRIIDVLAIKEYRLGMPYSKKIEDDLYELRVKSVRNIRLFYTFKFGRIILLHIISKESDKLAKKDLDTARQRLGWL